MKSSALLAHKNLGQMLVPGLLPQLSWGGGHLWVGHSMWTPFLPDISLSFQAHNDLLRTYEAKLLAFGIPLDNVGFKPLETAVIGQTLGQGPAGLVGAPT